MDLFISPAILEIRTYLRVNLNSQKVKNIFNTHDRGAAVYIEYFNKNH